MRSGVILAMLLLAAHVGLGQCGSSVVWKIRFCCDTSEWQQPICKGLGTTCMVDMPGIWCGNDDSGRQCYLSGVTGCVQHPASARMGQPKPATGKNLKRAELASRIPTCGGVQFGTFPGSSLTSRETLPR